MASIFSLADLLLSFGVSNKEMDFFGEQWKNWTARLKENWCDLIKNEDLVLIAGDISWALHPEEAKADLEFIHALPGTKVLLKGNHDFWWNSLSKVEKILPPSLHLIQNNSFLWNNIAIGGARLWDTSEYQFGAYIEYQENPRAKKLISVDPDSKENERIFKRELERLELSLKSLSKNADARIAMTHYPPISADLKDSRASLILEKYGIDAAVFGHLHNVKQDTPIFGKKNGINYYLTSCDYLNFKPIRIDIRRGVL